jgi:hypothetical protein
LFVAQAPARLTQIDALKKQLQVGCRDFEVLLLCRLVVHTKPAMLKPLGE